MEDAFHPDSLVIALNQSSAAHPGWNLSLSFPSRWAAPGQPERIISATAIALLALVGNCLLLHRLRCGGCCCCYCGGRFGRRRKMDFLLTHLALADLYGCGLALLSQLPPAADDSEIEPGEAQQWPAEDATCRLLRFLEGSGVLAPSHMLVLIALERHHVVRGPQYPQTQQVLSWMPARGSLAALGWLLAMLLALPQAFVYKLAGTPQHGGRCLSIFAQLPRWHSQVYAVYGAITGFVAPACLLGGTCGRILSALSASPAKEEEPAPRGAAGDSARHYRVELPGVPAPAPPPLLLRLLPVAKCALPSPPAPRSLPRARARALQMTLALAALFALCGFPRCVLELGLAFASSSESSTEEARRTLGSIMAATNSALNPYVCLLFHSHRPWARRLQRSLCRCPDWQPRRRAPHRHRTPPPQAAAEHSGLWFCPCQIKPPPTASLQQEELESRAPAAAAACESGL
ncbi:probable G-protein coupled receptor 150 [Hemicordylus capensis]|uniref:probable G-protein coupled receptor 150 n=1 Tax=Hemicordylus capensis TaxID=884348 RepID=UPI00230205EB|nr:probable G-protein coupled receptor 150 [Hemicordylus capensis]